MATVCPTSCPSSSARRAPSWTLMTTSQSCTTTRMSTLSTTLNTRGRMSLTSKGSTTHRGVHSTTLSAAAGSCSTGAAQTRKRRTWGRLYCSTHRKWVFHLAPGILWFLAKCPRVKGPPIVETLQKTKKFVCLQLQAAWEEKGWTAIHTTYYVQMSTYISWYFYANRQTFWSLQGARHLWFQRFCVFVLKFALPPFSPPLSQWCNFQNKTVTEPWLAPYRLILQ